MPGLWMCLFVTAVVVAPLLAVLSGVPVADVLGTSWRYVLENSLLHMRDYSVSGLPITGHEPQVVNGPLWTLWYEVACYVLIAIAGVVGVLRRPWLLPRGCWSPCRLSASCPSSGGSTCGSS